MNLTWLGRLLRAEGEEEVSGRPQCAQAYIFSILGLRGSRKQETSSAGAKQ